MIIDAPALSRRYRRRRALPRPIRRNKIDYKYTHNKTVTTILPSLKSKMRCWARLIFLFTSYLTLICDGARILGVFPCPSPSHLVVFSSLTKELARRGHEVTVISPYPLISPPANYTDINIMPELEELLEEMRGEGLFDMGNIPNIGVPLLFWSEGLQISEMTLRNAGVKDLLKDKRGFDLVIVEDFMTESLYAFADYFKAPLVLISSLGGLHSANYALGAPFYPSHMPNTMLTFADQMTLWERFQNTFISAFWDAGVLLFYLPAQERIRKKFFGSSTSSVWELRYQPSLLLLNTHFSLNSVRPLMPAIVEVGGMQISQISSNKTIDRDLKAFLDGASEHGVIYFSMGSNLDTEGMPSHMRVALLRAFSGVKQRVLMKWDLNTLEGQPPPENIRLAKWFPQQDVLAHPNVRVFVTHGGLLSLQEAAFHGVPLVGIPVFGDQMLNMRRADREGFGVLLEMWNVSTESLTWALNIALTDPRIREHSQRRSALFRDQPETPLERAVFWIEYVLRHGGAPHLKSAALDMSWYQLWYLDIFIILVLPPALLIFVLVRFCCRSVPTKTVGGRKTKGKKKEK